MNYNEEQQKIILYEMESDLMSLVAVDAETDDFEVIFSDGAYRDFNDRFQGKDFFGKWQSTGISMVWEADRERMRTELSKSFLLKEFEDKDVFVTACRFINGNSPVNCRVKVAKEVLDPHVFVISFRNIDNELFRQQQHERDMRRMKDDLDRMRINNFISQMHPHFLYNALSSIREIVLTDPEYGADLLYDFTTFLRANIKAVSGDEKISFSKEMETVRAYVNIEKMRFGDRLDIVYDLRTEDFMVIPLCVQPLVENAIKHGIYEKADDQGRVIISSHREKEWVTVCVEDDGVGFDVETVRQAVNGGQQDSTGLNNLIFRLEKMLSASVDIDSRVGEGTRVTVRIPDGC